MTATFQAGATGEGQTIIDHFYIVSDVQTSGSDSENHWSFMPKKNGTLPMRASPKTTVGSEMLQGRKYIIDVNQYELCAANTAFQMDITKNGVPVDISGARLAFGWVGRIKT